MARIVREVQPRFVFVENSPMLTSRGLGRVLGDLAAMGFDAEWGVLSCKDAGGVHLRERIWIVAANAKIMQRNGRANYRKHSKGKVSQFGNRTSAPDAPHDRRKRGEGIKQRTVFRFSRFPWGEDVRRVEDLRSRSDLPEPLIRRINHDVAAGMDRLKAVGNGQVSRVAATAWQLLSQRFND